MGNDSEYQAVEIETTLTVVIKFLLTFIITILVVYKTNIIITNIYFGLILLISYKSKKDYFWLALFILIYSFPGRLFYGTGVNLTKRLPIYSIISSISFSFDDFFPIIYIIKCNIKKKINPLKNKFFIGLIVYFGFVLTYSIIIGSNVGTIINSLRHIIIMLIYFPIVNLIEKKHIKLFLSLILLLSIISLIFTTFFFARGESFGSYMYGVNIDRKSALHELQEIDQFSDTGVVRYIDSINILFTIFVVSWYLILSKSTLVHKQLIFIAFFSSFLVVLLSATRGWMLGFTLLILLTFLFNRIRSHIIAKSFFVFSFLLIISLSFNPIKIQINNALIRFSSLKLILQGDTTAGGTNRRINMGNIFIEKGLESPLFGFGISKEGEKYFYSDVGMQSLFVQVGIIGLGFFMFWAIRYLIALKSIVIKEHNTNYNIFIYGFVCLLFMHMTTNIMFSFTKTAYATYWIPFYFSISHLIIKNKV